jgi:hypothetical protein
MPRKEIDYSKTVIYKIVCNDLSITDLYIGSTTDFRKRKNKHRSACINNNNVGYNLKVYTMIRENGGWDNWTMLEIEKYPCNNGNEARTRERYYIELLNSNMNIIIPTRTDKEYSKFYSEKNKDKIKEYREKNKDKIKEYRDLNKDKIKEYCKINRDKINERRKKLYNENEATKNKIKGYYKKNYIINKEKIKEKVKEYREDNKDTISLKKKEWYEINKDKVNERRREMYKLKKEQSV